MAFAPKNWQNSPSAATPLSAEAMEGLETRVTDYTIVRVGRDLEHRGAARLGQPDDRRHDHGRSALPVLHRLQVVGPAVPRSPPGPSAIRPISPTSSLVP